MKKLTFKSLLAAMILVLGACAATEPPNPLIGAWLLTITSPVGEMAMDLNVNPDLTGEMSNPDLGTAPLEGLTLVDSAVNFTTSIDAQGQSLTLVFSGAIDGDTITGNFDSPFGAIPAKAVRQ